MSRAEVLLVEDELDIRELVQQTLRRSHITLTAVANGEAALRHLGSHQVDLVILDIGLPGIGGWEVLQALRTRPGLASLPVLVVSVLDPADRPTAADVTYLSKPFRPAELARLVEQLLDRPTEGHP